MWRGRPNQNSTIVSPYTPNPSPHIHKQNAQDGSLLPFQEWLDWTQFAVLVPERSTGAIPAMLHAMSPATVLRMQRRGKAVYEWYLKDEGTLAWTLVETLKARVRALKAAAAAGGVGTGGQAVEVEASGTLVAGADGGGAAGGL